MKVKNKITNHCKQLRLPAIGEQVQKMADQAAATGISYLEFAENLLDAEIKYRNHKDQERKIKTARLPGRRHAVSQTGAVKRTHLAGSKL